MALGSLLASACGAGGDGDVTEFYGTLDDADATLDDGDETEALGNTSFPLLNTNNEFLLYAPRFNTTTGPFFGAIATAFADVTGDGKTDAIAVNNDRILVRRASTGGATFKTEEQWTTVPFWGSLGTFFADVTGDGKADAIADDPGGIVVWRSTGSAFNPVSEVWSTTGLSGAKGTFFADVNGDRKADLIAAGNDRVWVRLANSDGTGFLSSQAWTTSAFSGHKATAFADVTGDGKADAIAANFDKVYVRRSNGATFLTTDEAWTTEPAYGNVATFVTDVSADGLADFVTVNSNGIWAARSNRFHFGAWELLAEQTSVGTPFLADIDNDKRADQIEVTSTALKLSKSRTRDIKLRFVQFRANATDAVLSGSALEAAVTNANAVYAPAGLRFVRSGSHVVTSPELAEIHYTDTTQVPPSVLDLVKNSFNPTCSSANVPFGDLPAPMNLHVSEMWQVNWVASRCAFVDELLIYIANISNGFNTGMIPEYGKTAFLKPADIGNKWTFPHELGHVFGLDHPWGSLSTDPETQEWQKPSLIWDHVYTYENGNYVTFKSRAEAAAKESSLLPISRHPDEDRDWWCPEPTIPCPSNANSQPGTMMMLVYNSAGADSWFSSNDKMLSGFSLIQPDRRLTMNVMFYSGLTNNPSNLSGQVHALSEAQIEHIHRVLTFDMESVITDANGNRMRADRVLLGR